MVQISSVMGANESDIPAEDRCEARTLRQRFQVEGDRNAGVGLTALDLAQMAAATQSSEARHAFQGQAEASANVSKRGHRQKFARAEHLGKQNVRRSLTDIGAESSQIPNMRYKQRQPRHDLYPSYRERSGWYLAAWRDFAGLTLEDMAAEMGKSKGYVSDLETGAQRPDRAPPRFNRDLVELVSKIVGTSGGRLIDVNPFEMSERVERLNAAVAQLDEAGQDALLDMAERWLARSSAA